MEDAQFTKQEILNHYETLLIEGGPSLATMGRLAERSQLSRGGLVYHFPTKADVEEAFVRRLEFRCGQFSAGMVQAPEGAVRHYLLAAGLPLSDLDRTILAATRLASDSQQKLAQVFAQAESEWLRILTHSTGDAALAELIILLGDGIHYHATIAAMEGAEVAMWETHRNPDTMMALIEQLMEVRGVLPSRGFLG